MVKSLLDVCVVFFLFCFVFSVCLMNINLVMRQLMVSLKGLWSTTDDEKFARELVLWLCDEG